jgi:hypothetical protein
MNATMPKPTTQSEKQEALMQTNVYRASCGAKNQHQFSRAGK